MAKPVFNRTVLKDYTPQVLAEKKAKIRVGLRLIAQLAVDTSTPFTPRRTGDLRRNVAIELDPVATRVTLTWLMEYAAAQEKGSIKGSPIVNYSTAGTGKGFARKGVKKAVAQGNSILKQVTK